MEFLRGEGCTFVFDKKSDVHNYHGKVQYDLEFNLLKVFGLTKRLSQGGRFHILEQGSYQFPREKFRNGEIHLLRDWASQMATLKNVDDWDYTQLPSNNAHCRSTIRKTWAMTISASSPNLERAIQVIQCLTSDKYQVKNAQFMGWIPFSEHLHQRMLP
jgi:hypothetical protein